jgi:hypothetical protein
MEDGRDRLVLQMIGAAVLAGAYGRLLREHPEAKGLDTLRRKWSARVEALAGDVVTRAATQVTR